MLFGKKSVTIVKMTGYHFYYYGQLSKKKEEAYRGGVRFYKSYAYINF